MDDIDYLCRRERQERAAAKRAASAAARAAHQELAQRYSALIFVATDKISPLAAELRAA